MRRTSSNLKLYKAVCFEIWEEREHKCEDCGKPLIEARWHNFAHIDGRRTPEKCLDKNNIKLKCFKCHAQNDGKLIVKNAEWLDS